MTTYLKTMYPCGSFKLTPIEGVVEVYSNKSKVFKDEIKNYISRRITKFIMIEEMLMPLFEYEVYYLVNSEGQTIEKL